MLAVTDARAAASGRPVIVRAYKSVRGGAGRQSSPLSRRSATWC